MSTIAPSSSPPVAATRPASTRGLMARAVRAALAGTPGRLRLATAVSVVACLLFGVLSFVAATSRAAALSDAQTNTSQLVRIQSIRTNLVYADANLTNAFLVGGLEPAAARRAYEQGIGAASQGLAESAANPADAVVLAKVNAVVSRYTGLVETARSNNRLGYPLGAAYLRQATDLLRSDALPPLESLGRTEQERVNHAFDRSATATIWLTIGIVVALIVLIGVQIWLGAWTHRVFNPPLVAATVIVVIVSVVLSSVMVWSQSRARHTRDGAYFLTLELTTTRTDAFDAKSDESLTLINRGNGQVYEAAFQDLAANARVLLADAARRGGADAQAARQAFAAYRATHRQIRAEDDRGSWDQAVKQATGSSAADSNAVFGQFDTASAQALDQQVRRLHEDLRSARAPLTGLAWMALVLGVVAAGAAGAGVMRRLREYR
jgi:hypothetical protein